MIRANNTGYRNDHSGHEGSPPPGLSSEQPYGPFRTQGTKARARSRCAHQAELGQHCRPPHASLHQSQPRALSSPLRVCRGAPRALSEHTPVPRGPHPRGADAPTRRRASLLSFWGLVPTRAEPLRKKKKVDPKKDQAAKERLKKRIRRLEKATQELIPIEDFITPVKLLNQARQRPPVELPFEESERRALLLKKWSLYKQREHELERAAIASLLEAQREALQELELTAPELHAEATKRDPSLFPFERQGPDYTPPIANYQPPEGRYQDITKVYTQVEFKR
nr:PREDICTED: 39S ribosomal protein L40, mitochondrial [Bos mutus]